MTAQPLSLPRRRDGQRAAVGLAGRGSRGREPLHAVQAGAGRLGAAALSPLGGWRWYPGTGCPNTQPPAAIALPTSFMPCAVPLSGTLSSPRSERVSNCTATCSAACGPLPMYRPPVIVT